MSREKTFRWRSWQVIICAPFEEYGILSGIIYTIRIKLSSIRRDDAAEFTCRRKRHALFQILSLLLAVGGFIYAGIMMQGEVPT